MSDQVIIVEVSAPGGETTVVETAAAEESVVAVVEVNLAASGEDGVGVPTGGAAGALLQKQSVTNYDTDWTTTLDHAALTIDGGIIE